MPIKNWKFLGNTNKRLIIPVFFSIMIIAMGIVAWHVARYKVIINEKEYLILVRRSSNYSKDPENRKMIEWLAQRWGTPTENLYLINQDSETWMKIYGILDLKTLSSARVWNIDSNKTEGQSWISNLTKRDSPHIENIYLYTEYRPASEANKKIAARFYATPLYWRDNLFGELAIIECIKWSNLDNKTGEIMVYQSQDFLPPITIPIENNNFKKWNSYNTPIVQYETP